MSNQKPDGWATTSPEGEYTGNDDEIILTRVDCELVEDGYRTFPVCLIDPQELSRLRAIEEWASIVAEVLKAFLDTTNCEGRSLLDMYRKITEAK